MEGLLGLLVFGVLFYLMMRFGCGVRVAADRGYSMTHAGTRRWFCSKTCLDKFEADPAKYAAPAVRGNGQGSEHGGHP